MKTVNVQVGESYRNRIAIGRRGETEVTEIVFDVSQLISTYGNGTAVLMAKRPIDTTAYPVAVVQDGNTVTWTVTDTDTSYKGQGECELFWYVGDALAKSVVFSTVILRDIGDTTGEAPDPYETWLDTLVSAGAEVSEAINTFTGLRAEATTLAAGSAATASYEDGVLTLGIPRGDTGATGAAGNVIWYTNDEITGDAEECGIGRSSIKGPSGKTMKPGDFVLGPEIGTSGDPNTLYVVQYFINTQTSWVVLERIGSIKGEKGDTGEDGSSFTFTDPSSDGNIVIAEVNDG